MRTAVPIAAALFAIAAAVAVATRTRPDNPPRSNDADPSTVASLKDEVRRLHARVEANESEVTHLGRTSARDRLEAEAKASSTSPQSSAQSNVERPPTREEQTIRFENYFSKLDAMRGQAPDSPLEARFAEAITGASSDFAVLRAAKLDSVNCGNNLCRVEITFADLNTARQGQTELRFQLGTLASGASMYMAPDSPHLRAYFSSGGTRLPKFSSLAD
jgi:hypothetical protein